jgi:hypothetical protein
MTRDDIIRMALDAHLLNYVDLETPRRYFICADAGVEEVERFAALVAAAEREACAKVCEDLDESDTRFRTTICVGRLIAPPRFGRGVSHETRRLQAPHAMH